MSDETLLNEIRVASIKLDVDNDDHWTADGLPGLEAIHHFAGNQRIKRGDVTNALPDFNREAARAALAATPPAPPAAAGEQPKVDANGFILPQEHSDEELALTEEQLDAAIADIAERRVALQTLLDEHRKGMLALDEEETKWLDIKNRRFPPKSFSENIEAHLAAILPLEAQKAKTAETVRKALVDAGVLKEGEKLKTEPK